MLRCVILSLALVLSVSAASARSEKTLAYPRDAAWPAAVRFIRVDEGLKIVEKDTEAGYVLFEVREEGKTFRGSLEVMTVIIDGRTLVRFVVQVEDRPSWTEIAMLTRLERKLRSELGTPAPPPSKAKPAPDDKQKDKPKPEKEREGENEPKKPDEGAPPISPTP